MSTRPTPSPSLRLAIDYGPLLVFFVVNFLAPAGPSRALIGHFTGSLSAMSQVEALVIARALVATGAFIVATLAAMLLSLARLGSISVMLWISGVLVVVFGGLTMWFHDPRFIQMKPTIVYVTLAALLAFGLATGRPLVQQLLGTTYPGLTDEGWRRLTVNWAMFFAAMAVANEIARHLLSFGAWTIYKFPICVIVSFLFAMANVPMLLRHGLATDDAASQLPPEA